MSFNGEVDVSYLQNELKEFYNLNSILKKEESLPLTAYDSRYQRFHAGRILKYQSTKYPSFFTIGLTSKDIAMNKHNMRGFADWGILGYSVLGGHVSVLSTFRIKSKNRKQQTTKVLLHEVGHGIGLPHCESALPCLMKDVKGKLSNLDKQPKKLCYSCKVILQLKKYL